MTDTLTVSAPGRICLFGEHQDYFGLPIIAAAIDRRITISGRPIPEKTFRIELPDIDDHEDIPYEEDLAYTRERDYLKSAVNVQRRMGIRYSGGMECTVRGTIPINSGTSSSSALVVAWNRFLLELAADERRDDPEAVAELGFLTEVAEFNEPGGKMDHYASAVGGIVNIHFGEQLRVRTFPNRLQEFVLADSLIRKDTTGTLGYIKSHVLEGVGILKSEDPGFDLTKPLEERHRTALEKMGPDVRRLLEGTLDTRDLTRQGERLFQEPSFDHERFGRLLLRQHAVIRDRLRLSLPKLDRMIETACEAGALGGKLNGSGQGGCIFAYAPGRAEEVAEALAGLDTRPFVIRVDQGVRREEESGSI